MKQVIIKIKIENERFGTLIKHKGFDNENVDYILTVVGIIEQLKKEMLNKLESKKE